MTEDEMRKSPVGRTFQLIADVGELNARSDAFTARCDAPGYKMTPEDIRELGDIFKEGGRVTGERKVLIAEVEAKMRADGVPIPGRGGPEPADEPEVSNAKLERGGAEFLATIGIGKGAPRAEEPSPAEGEGEAA